MAKKQNKERNYSEADIIRTFGLTRVPHGKTTLMQEWLHCTTSLQTDEATLFRKILENAQNNIEGWQEEDLKMKFVAFVLALACLEDAELYHTYFDATISATVEGHFLKTKTDFMVAKGILDSPETPYFHFQEYKKQREPSGDPVAQLLEAFLIAQEKNKNGKPLYGCTIIGKYWEFFTMEAKTYCISKSYDCTDELDLLQIIAILRKFKEILETRLLD